MKLIQKANEKPFQRVDSFVVLDWLIAAVIVVIGIVAYILVIS